MAAITDVPKQGFDQLLETNRQMHNTMTDMNKLLSNLVSLMQKNEIVMEPDLERGIHVSFEAHLVLQYFACSAYSPTHRVRGQSSQPQMGTV